GRVVGKKEIRAYWTRQWKEFDPHVTPIEVIDREEGKTDVRVHQLVKSLGGDVLSDSEVWHVYTVANGLIERMDLGENEASSEPGPSEAFARLKTLTVHRIALRTVENTSDVKILQGNRSHRIEQRVYSSAAPRSDLKPSR